MLLVDEIKAIRNFPIVIAERLGYLKGDGVVVTVMNIRDDVSTADMLMDGRVDAVMAYYHHNIVNDSQGRDFEAIITLGVTLALFAGEIGARLIAEGIERPEERDTCAEIGIAFGQGYLLGKPDEHPLVDLVGSLDVREALRTA